MGIVHQTVECAHCAHWYIKPCVSKEQAAKCGNTKPSAAAAEKLPKVRAKGGKQK